jgi:Pyrimidine dimer DNA glycosylase
MRLWSLHPKYLDPQGLVALWRESLLAQAVLRGRTRGYRNHPQLDRFRSQAAPLTALSAYLREIHAEAAGRGYSFDESKLGRVRPCPLIPVGSCQLELEWEHLLAKLSARNPAWHGRWRTLRFPECHPLFQVRPGGVEPWERQRRSAR